MPPLQTFDGLRLTPQALLHYAQSVDRANDRPPLTSEPTSRSLPAPVVVRSVAGTRTRLHKLDNHFAWLAVALHLESLGGGAPSSRRCAAAQAVAGRLPDGNHGETPSTESEA